MVTFHILEALDNAPEGQKAWVLSLIKSLSLLSKIVVYLQSNFGSLLASQGPGQP